MNPFDAVRVVSELETRLVWESIALLRCGVWEFFTFHLWSFLKTEKDIISSLGSIITALTAVGGVYFALENLSSIKENSEAQTRPYINASLALGVQHYGSVDLIIENRGNSVAENIRFFIDDSEYSEGRSDYITNRYRENVAKKSYSLPPNTRFRWMWSAIFTNETVKKQFVYEEGKVVKKLLKDEQDRVGYVEEVLLTIKYQSAKGVFEEIKHYEDTYKLDAEAFTDLAPQPAVGAESSSSDKKAAALSDINKALRTHNIHVGMSNY